MKKFFILSFWLLCVFLFSCKNDSFRGYTLVEKKFVKEVNADCYLLEHIKTGARIFKIAADDPNKTFVIAFSTLPGDDCGTPHILEHSVLNGSKRFPVKSPFDVLLKGSLKTFLNAFTSFDCTLYPVASRNEKDYFNLMNVYLDAVFNPLIYSDPRILMQEGWHYELKDKSSPVDYKGVVYNEMKGAYSNPDRILLSGIKANLLPETPFRFSSGGLPSDIPKLTYHSFIDFHKKYYHPSNSYIMLYGDADLASELEFIDKEYLSGYERTENPVNMKKQQPFASEKESKLFYPVLETDDVKNQTYLALNWVAGSGTDGLINTTLNILSEVLINQESAPLRIALIKAGVGKEVYSMPLSGQFQNIFSIISRNADSEDKEKFRNIILETLRKVCEEGIDKEALRGAINREEFYLREGDDSQKGLLYSFRSIIGWIYSGNPIPLLEYETYLNNLKSLADGPYFEDFIKQNFLNNNHRALLILEPSPGMEKKNIVKIADELDKFKKTLSERQLDSLVALTKNLIAYQQSEDNPETLASVPMLKLSDINPEASWYGCSVNEIDGVTNLFHNEFTNGIVYSTLWFDIRALPQEMIPYAKVIAQLSGKLGTANFDFSELEKSVKINTGGFNSTIDVLLPDNDDDKMIPAFTLNMKTTADKIDTAMLLIAEIVGSTTFDDRERIRELLIRNHANLKASLIQDGYTASIKRFESYISKRGMIIEQTSNIEYYNFLTALIEKYEKEPDNVISDLRYVADIMFSRSNLSAGVTCDDSDFKKYSSALGSFISELPVTKNEIKDWTLSPIAFNEGIITPSKVQYVIKGFDYKKLGLQWSGKWNVLRQILSTDYLQTQLRVIGGAYGGRSFIHDQGTVMFCSYRDPNLSETLDRYDKMPEYLLDFKADSSSMTRYILGTISNKDPLLTPYERGTLAFDNYFRNKTPGSAQKEWDEILSTTAQDINHMNKFISEILGQNVICVYGGEDKIRANKNIFKRLLTIGEQN